MSLAELLKADLEDLEDEQDEEQYDDENNNNLQTSFKAENYEIEDVGMAVDNTDDKMSMQLGDFSKESVRNIAKLLDSHQLKLVIEKIEKYQTEGSTKRGEIVGPVEEDAE